MKPLSNVSDHISIICGIRLPNRHCEEKRRSNPENQPNLLDCFASFANRRFDIVNDAKRQKNSNMFKNINFVEIFSSFIVMAAIIDIFGSIPIFVSMKEQNKTIKAGQACLTALGLFLAFFFAGDALLKLFGIDAASFAVAGSFVLFILAVEMILGREIIKNEGGKSGASIVPIAFPLIAGPGALTALLSLRAEYAIVNILIGLLLNILLDYIVISQLDRIRKLLGENLIFILRKFFGVILLAIAVNLFVNNISVIIANVQK